MGGVILLQRVNCPCCGYPTIESHGNYEICQLCHWEDDGQNDLDADEILGGPNGDYSLTEARNNFTEHLIMYRDKKNTDQKLEIKKALIRTFTELDKYEVGSLEYEECWNKIHSYEKILTI